MISLLILGGCSATMGSRPSSLPATVVRQEYCLVDTPIGWRLEDVVVKPDNLTMLHIKEHNAVYKRICIDPPH